MNTTGFLLIRSLSLGLCAYSGLMDNATPQRSYTRIRQKTQVHGNLTWSLAASYYCSFYIGADTPTLEEYCVHEPLILHGCLLGAGTHLQLWVAGPKEEQKQPIIDPRPSPLYLAAPYTVLTVLKRPSLHGFWTVSAKSIWVSFFDYHQPGGWAKKNSGLGVWKPLYLQLYPLLIYLKREATHTEQSSRAGNKLSVPFWPTGPP